ncbi:amidoligase family protein [Clostridium fessum]|uniref:amidoligase family protein n=1 Tax=Clostridium fessum TaxID=2126740 RepID=UPI00399AD906
MIGLKDQCFGVEVELTGITRQAAAQALAEYFETSAQHIGGIYDAWAVTDLKGKTWKLMSDSSIRTERRTESGYQSIGSPFYQVEMVTPKLTYDELPKFQECVRCMRRAGGKVNNSCGLHVHVDAANHNRQSLKNLIGIMYSKEDMLFKALQVNEARASRWCQKVREPMLREARKLSSDETHDLTKLESIWYEGVSGSHEHYNWTRYYALNLHSVFYRGTVEWRCFNSTLHAGRAAAYVNLCLAISAQAIAQRSTVMRKTQSDNELFTFRTWLVRLGLNGAEFKNTRDHLLANLEGDRAWRYDKDSYEVNKKKKIREMER